MPLLHGDIAAVPAFAENARFIPGTVDHELPRACDCVSPALAQKLCPCISHICMLRPCGALYMRRLSMLDLSLLCRLPCCAGCQGRGLHRSQRSRNVCEASAAAI